MNGQPERRWFQIHLSTAIILMLCAGSLLLANFRAENLNIQSRQKEFITFQYRGPGWPWAAWYAMGATSSDQGLDDEISWSKHKPDIALVSVVNGIACLFFLSLVAIGCEWTIRRKSLHK